MFIREQSAGRQRVSPSLIAGSALPLTWLSAATRRKSLSLDRCSAAPGAAYWIEDVDINGTRTMHGPASVESASTNRAQFPRTHSENFTTPARIAILPLLSKSSS